MSELKKLDNEHIEETLYRLGKMKIDGNIRCTWQDIADMLNEDYCFHYCESRYRKLFYQLKRASEQVDNLLYNSDLSSDIKENVKELEKKRIHLQQEKTEYRRAIKTEALFDRIQTTLVDEVKRLDPIVPSEANKDSSEKVMYALLSDVHYGIEFDSFDNRYNTDIARERVLNYAHEIVRIGKANGVNICYVSLLGDMISGGIHNQIRLENAENLISQTMHISEITATFFKILSEYYKQIIVNNVGGNHSRIVEKKDAMRTERLDDIVFWYCKARFENIPHVVFLDDNLDPTIALFEIAGKTYVSVHGDFDQNVSDSSRRIAELLNRKVDYFVSGHKHIAESRIDNTGYICNGAVVTGGDDYTARRRLFGPAVQVCMLCSEKGVEAIYPVRL